MCYSHHSSSYVRKAHFSSLAMSVSGTHVFASKIVGQCYTIFLATLVPTRLWHFLPTRIMKTKLSGEMSRKYWVLIFQWKMVCIVGKEIGCSRTAAGPKSTKQRNRRKILMRFFNQTLIERGQRDSFGALKKVEKRSWAETKRTP